LSAELTKTHFFRLFGDFAHWVLVHYIQNGQRHTSAQISLSDLIYALLLIFIASQMFVLTLTLWRMGALWELSSPPHPRPLLFFSMLMNIVNDCAIVFYNTYQLFKIKCLRCVYFVINTQHNIYAESVWRSFHQKKVQPTEEPPTRWYSN